MCRSFSIGGNELGGARPGPNARLMAILCVGGAYFVIGVLFPLTMFLSGTYQWPTLKATGLVFASLAGVAGAVGAICVIFATQAAVGAAREAGATTPSDLAQLSHLHRAADFRTGAGHQHARQHDMASERRSRAVPLRTEDARMELWVGILLVGVGAALVLYSKEAAEVGPPKAAACRWSLRQHHRFRRRPPRRDGLLLICLIWWGANRGTFCRPILTSLSAPASHICQMIFSFVGRETNR